MENEPGRNSGGEVALFDLDGDQVEGARCEGPDCETALPSRTGRGRRLAYCSQACKSRADRARVKARTAAALLGPDGSAVAADATPQERPEGERPAAGLLVERQRVLGAADAIRNRAEDFLAAVDDDPMSAHAKLAEDVYVLVSLLVTSARDVRDAVRWPGLDADARTEARIREEWNLPDAAPGNEKSPRGDFLAPLRDGYRAGETPRSENGAVSSGRPAAPKTPRGETTGAAPGTDERAPLHAAVTNPLTRFGRPGREDDLTITFGEGWQLATWDTPDAGGTQLLLREGAPVGWTARLPQGPWGLGGWIAVEHQDGQLGRFVAGPLSRPQTFTTADLALDALHRADRHRAAASQPAAPVAPVAAAELPDEVPVPKLALGRTTGWLPPTDRGLGEAHRDYALGDGLVHLTWPGKPGV
ncbi:hypothetical protein ACIQOV_38590, partial [Kitasatospora sp. NPDC091257]|uniref:hypothetical protein n=1 Tax=Kitasatospora sp. NPDC091257 TaxID=3364084 RepID=UPI0038152470